MHTPSVYFSINLWRDLHTHEENHQIKLWAPLQASYTCSPIRPLGHCAEKTSMVRGTLHWNTNLSLPSSTTHTFLLLTDASSRFKQKSIMRQVNVPLVKCDLHSCHLCSRSTQQTPVMLSRCQSRTAFQSSSCITAFNKHTFNTGQDWKWKPKLEIFSLIKIHMNLHINRWK